MTERKWRGTRGTVGRGGGAGLLTRISARRFIFRWAPVPRRLPPAQSSFEVIMGLLANAPLQVPSSSSSTTSVSQRRPSEMRRDGNPFQTSADEAGRSSAASLMSFAPSA